jgi:hypothetical protein
MATAALTVLLLGRGLSHSYDTLKQRTYEQDEAGAMMVAEDIRKNVPEDGLVLAPPYYAVLAQRKIVEDYSEILLWQLKYHNEAFDKVRGRGVETTERIAQSLREKKVAFVVLDLNQTGKIKPIADAIAASYEPVRIKELRTLNTSLMYYRPKGAPATDNMAAPD